MESEHLQKAADLLQRAFHVLRRQAFSFPTLHRLEVKDGTLLLQWYMHTPGIFPLVEFDDGLSDSEGNRQSALALLMCDFVHLWMYNVIQKLLAGKLFG